MAITASTWSPVGMIGLNQAIDTTSTTQLHPVGLRVVCKDVGSTARGFGEFIYLPGVASTVAGDLVLYEVGGSGTTIRAVARSEGALAVAMSANVASSWGWYQIFGRGVVTAATVADNAQCYLCATTAAIDDAHVAGDTIFGMRTAGATDTGQALVDMSYPSCADTDDA